MRFLLSSLPPLTRGSRAWLVAVTDPDLAVQLHFALFKGTGGYLLKPADMTRHQADDDPATLSHATSACGSDPPLQTAVQRRSSQEDSSRKEDGKICRNSDQKEDGKNRRKSDKDSKVDNEDDVQEAYWPPSRERLHRASLEIISLHQLPKVGWHSLALDLLGQLTEL